MDRLAFQCTRPGDTESISAPAKNVSTREPTLARKWAKHEFG